MYSNKWYVCFCCVVEDIYIFPKSAFALLNNLPGATCVWLLECKMRNYPSIKSAQKCNKCAVNVRIVLLRLFLDQFLWNPIFDVASVGFHRPALKMYLKITFALNHQCLVRYFLDVASPKSKNLFDLSKM